MRIKETKFLKKTEEYWRRLECTSCGARESIYSKEASAKHIKQIKVCRWCGEEVVGSTSNFCSEKHEVIYKRAVSNGLLKEVYPIPYGSHAFDGWVNLIWNGSGVRGHATAA